MTDYSVLFPMAPVRPEHLLPFAALVQWTAARRLWQGQTVAVDPFQTTAGVAAAGFRVPAGVGVTLMPLRNPVEVAVQARTLAGVTGHPFVLGIGPGSVSLQRALLPEPYARPLAAAREYLTIVRALLDGRSPDVTGEYFRCEAELPMWPSPEVEVGLGVLRPGAARLAGEVADRAVTWLTPASYVRDTLVPALREGAERAGRPVPRITCMVPLALAGDDRDPVRLALASNAAHLSAPHYVDMLARAGVHVDAGRPAAAAEALVKGKGFLHGDLDELADDLAAYEEAGVDEVVLNTLGVLRTHGVDVAVNELETVIERMVR